MNRKVGGDSKMVNSLLRNTYILKYDINMVDHKVKKIGAYLNEI